MRDGKTNVGDRFGRLTVIAPAQTIRKVTRWVCRCDCGVEKTIPQTYLRSGTKSCGCLSGDTAAARAFKHGKSESPEYAVWSTMKARVLNPNNWKFHRYGGRGIKICDRWLVFENFIADMGKRPGKGFSLERIDNDGDYCPENCKWIPMEQQARNRRDTRFLTIDGVTRPFVEWCEVYGVSQDTTKRRIYQYGWDVLKAFTAPVHRSRWHNAPAI